MSNNDTIEFSSLKLLGYYPNPSSMIDIEIKYSIETSQLANLLKASFDSVDCIKSVDSEFREILLNSKLIFKNSQGHLFSYIYSKNIVNITNVHLVKSRIIRFKKEYQTYFVPGEPFIINCDFESSQSNGKTETKVTVEIKDIVNIDGIIYYQVYYANQLCLVKLMPFELQILESLKSKKNLNCIYQGLDYNGNPILIQDRCSYIDDLYEEDTIQPFMYGGTSIDYKSDGAIEYHYLRDKYGLKHRFYGKLKDEERIIGKELILYVKRIDPITKRLTLTYYNPKIDEKEWFSADRVFDEIDESNNKEQYFDCFFTEKNITKRKDLVGQYKGKSNLWLFTYLNIIDNDLVSKYIRTHKIEELATISEIMIKLQEWLVEKSSFLDLFSDDKKDDTIQKSSFQIIKYQRILLATEIVKKGEQQKFIEDIVKSIKKSGRLAIRREERIEVLTYILRIYPDYLLQETDSTCDLIESLISLDGISEYNIESIVDLLNKLIEKTIHKISYSTMRTNDIDTSQIVYIKDILFLLGLKIIIYSHEKWHNELYCREAKARFFRFLSFLCADDLQNSVLKAGIDSLVGVLDDKDIFSIENISHLNPIRLSLLTTNAPVLDNNIDNDFYFSNSKTGILSLDAIGFTLIPYKQCISSYINCFSANENVNILHHLDSLPLKLGSMYSFKNIYPNDSAVEQYMLWNSITRAPHNLEKKPKTSLKLGDSVKVIVKEQTQPDKLKFMLFVSTFDPNFEDVDGVILVNELSSKWVEDVRTIFKVGDVFYAKVCHIDNGKYNFSIKEQIQKFATYSSSVIDDAKQIVINNKNVEKGKHLPKGFIQELILLIDMYIRKELNSQTKLTLLGYAYCLSALVSDPKSYYYDLQIRYYACIEKFVSGTHKDLNIDFNANVEKYFSNATNKLRLMKLLSLIDTSNEEDILSLASLAKDENNNDVGKLAAMLLTYIYAQKAKLTSSSLNAIKQEINDYVGNSEKLDFSSLDNDMSKEEDDEDENVNDIEEYDNSLYETSQIETEVIEPEVIVTKDTTSLDFLDDEFRPIKLSVNNDSSIIISNDFNDPLSEDSVIDIIVKGYARHGYVLLVFNTGEIAKIPVKSLCSLEFDKRIENFINPNKISNYFTIASDCIFGFISTTEEGIYIDMYNTSCLQEISLNDIQLKKSFNKGIIRHQPFILPLNNGIIGIEDFFNKSTLQSNIPVEISVALKAYGVYI